MPLEKHPDGRLGMNQPLEAFGVCSRHSLLVLLDHLRNRRLVGLGIRRPGRRRRPPEHVGDAPAAVLLHEVQVVLELGGEDPGGRDRPPDVQQLERDVALLRRDRTGRVVPGHLDQCLGVHRHQRRAEARCGHRASLDDCGVHGPLHPVGGARQVALGVVVGRLPDRRLVRVGGSRGLGLGQPREGQQADDAHHTGHPLHGRSPSALGHSARASASLDGAWRGQVAKRVRICHFPDQSPVCPRTPGAQIASGAGTPSMQAAGEPDAHRGHEREAGEVCTT